MRVSWSRASSCRWSLGDAVGQGADEAVECGTKGREELAPQAGAGQRLRGSRGDAERSAGLRAPDAGEAADRQRARAVEVHGERRRAVEGHRDHEVPRARVQSEHAACASPLGEAACDPGRAPGRLVRGDGVPGECRPGGRRWPRPREGRTAGRSPATWHRAAPRAARGRTRRRAAGGRGGRGSTEGRGRQHVGVP